MRKAGVFLDISNLYFCVQKKYNKKVDYKKYLAFLSDLYSVELAFAYVANNNGQSMPFVHALEKMNVTIRSKDVKEYSDTTRKCNLDVDMAIDMVNMVGRVDVVILGSADGDMAPAVKWLDMRSISTVAFACGISSDLKACCKSVLEIPPSVLEDK